MRCPPLRLRWLAAAIVALAPACAGSGTPRPPLQPLPDRGGAPPQPATGRTETHEIFSAALGVRKHLLVHFPASYNRDDSRRFPVVFYLHGLFGSETDWLSKGSIDIVADSLFAAGTREMIVVMPDGDDGWYTTWTHQVAYRACADTVHVEAPDRYCVEHERYDDYIARDLVAFVDRHFRTIADRAHRGIAGLSMGGYGALSLALRYPDVFGAGASHSGVVSPLYVGPRPFAGSAQYASTTDQLRQSSGGIWARYENFWGTSLERWHEADPTHVVELLVRHGARIPALFFDCGTDDGLIDQNRALNAELTRLGVTHHYAEWPGAHTWRYWNAHAPQSLVWMAEHIAR